MYDPDIADQLEVLNLDRQSVPKREHIQHPAGSVSGINLGRRRPRLAVFEEFVFGKLNRLSHPGASQSQAESELASVTVDVNLCQTTYRGLRTSLGDGVDIA